MSTHRRNSSVVACPYGRFGHWPNRDVWACHLMNLSLQTQREAWRDQVEDSCDSNQPTAVLDQHVVVAKVRRSGCPL